MLSVRLLYATSKGEHKMVFSSLQFIFIFIPIFFGCYYMVPNRNKNYILLIGSLCFYFVGTIKNPEYLILFIVSILVDYVVGLGIEKYSKHKKIFLVAGILFHIGSLVIFKYLNFVLGEVSRYVESFNFTKNIVLPIGISFYTFQGISYIVDVYKENIKAEKSLLHYAVYIAMFEQLIAGPIITYKQVRKELYVKRINKSFVMDGIGTFVIGLGLKVLLANPIGKLWTQTCAIGFESISTPLAWLSIFAFTFQIYFDFWGYSLMAIGLGNMLGFHLPKNFDNPYLSLTMTEFWRRWHITLGSWFREYVYIPLGGNKNGMMKTIRNLLIVWLLTGIWHGAGYNFILWGSLLFTILVLEKFFIGKFLNRFPVIGHLYMFIIIPLSWAVFAIDDIGQLGIFFTRLFPFLSWDMQSVFPHDYLKYWNLYYPFFIAGILFSTKIPFQIVKKIKSKKILSLLLIIIFIACVYCLYRGLDDPFLYFRF